MSLPPHLRGGGVFGADLIGFGICVVCDTFLSARSLYYELVVRFLPNFHGYIIWT